MDNLPREIVRRWVRKSNSEVCKLWREIWFAEVKTITINGDVSFRFQYLVSLQLYYEVAIDWTTKSLSSVKTLILDNNKFATNRDLRHMTNLTSLSLRYNDMITSIKYLTNLVHLDLTDNIGLNKIEIGNITDLRIRNNVFTNREPLKHLTNLKSLEIGAWNPKNDIWGIRIRGVSSLIHLTSLSVCYNQYIGDEQIKGLTNLKDLRITKSLNIRAGSIKYLTNLTSLHADGQYITDDAFKNLTNLRHLYLSEVDGTRGDGIAHLTNLESLNVHKQDMIECDFRDLTNLRSLVLFDVGGVFGHDIAYLPNLTSLEVIEQDMMGYSFRNLTNLRTLNLSYVTDVNGIANLTNLRKLRLCKTKSGNDIACLTNLESLELSRIHDIKNEYIYKLVNIKEITISGCHPLNRRKIRNHFSGRVSVKKDM